MLSLEEQIQYCKQQFARTGKTEYRDLLDSLVLLDSTELFPKDIDTREFQQFYIAWHNFRVQVLKTKPRMTPGQGVALKKIIRHLMRISKDHSYGGALKGWKLIINRWSELTPHLQGQVSLVQVNENLEEILTRLFNVSHGKRQENHTIAPGGDQPGKGFGKL